MNYFYPLLFPALLAAPAWADDCPEIIGHVLALEAAFDGLDEALDLATDDQDRFEAGFQDLKLAIEGSERMFELKPEMVAAMYRFCGVSPSS